MSATNLIIIADGGLERSLESVNAGMELVSVNGRVTLWKSQLFHF